MIIEQLTHFIINFVQSYGYLAVFVLMTLDSICIPIPSEITMPFAGYLAFTGHGSLIIYILVGTAASLIGSYAAYAIGYYLEETIILSLIDKYGKYILLRKHEYEKSMLWFKKYGAFVVFIGRLLPGLRTFISLPAGLSEMNLIKFSIYTVLGSFAWSAVLTYIGFYLGKHWSNIHYIFSKLEYAIAIIILIGICYYLYKHFKKIPAAKNN